MRKTVQYKNDAERKTIIESHNHLYLVEEKNIIEGNFLIFSDALPEPPKVYVSVPEEEFEGLKQDNQLLKAQSQANSDRADFQEDLIVEMAMKIYS
ncbi:hypothetical protein [Sporosarcina sp. NPDC096371]|uniref:hypothetical protein n=1 Tax=Sporosarcina sp. NPDC096371 TaxID=3364530 RepID=UPI00382211DA